MVVGWPIFLLKGTRRQSYTVVLFIFTYSNIIGILYFFGIWAGLAALAIKFVVGRFSFHHYFMRAVEEYADWEYQQMLNELEGAGVPLEQVYDVYERVMRTVAPPDFQVDEPAMREEAYRRARYAIEKRVMRG